MCKARHSILRFSPSGCAIAALLLVLSASCGKRATQRDSNGAQPFVRGSVLFTLEDGDVPPNAYADGRILIRDPAARDTLTALALPVPRPGDGSEGAMSFAQVGQSNSALGADGSLALSRQGTRALVATTHAPAPAAAVRVEQLPLSTTVTLIDVAAWPPRALASTEVGAGPVSVCFSPDGTLAACVSRAARSLVLLQILPAGFGGAVFVDLAGAMGFDAEPSGVAWSPRGDALCVTTGAPGAMVFLDVDLSDFGEPKIELLGQPLRFGAYLRSPHWTLDGRRLVVADTGWPSADSGLYVLEPAGGVHLVRAPRGDAGAQWVESTGLVPAPHAIALAPDERSVAVVAMRRADLFATTPRLGGVVSVLGLDASGFGEIASALCGPLPHDVAFSADGRHMVVAEFSEGRLEIFEVDPLGRPVATGVRIETNHGVHQVEVAP